MVDPVTGAAIRIWSVNLVEARETKSSKKVTELLARIDQLEKELACAKADAFRSTISPHLPESKISASNQATLRVGQNWYHRGMPIVSEDGVKWIKSTTMQDTTRFEKHLLGSAHLFSCISYPTHPSSGESWELPDIGLAFRTFKPDTNLAYAAFNPNASQRHLAARASLLAAFTAASYLKTSEEVASIDAQAIASRAQSLLGRIDGFANLDALQAILLLYKYRVATGQYDAAGALLPTACRMVCALDGHMKLPTPSKAAPDVWKEHIRNLFWTCYIADKDMSLITGQPPLLSDEYMDLRDAECSSPAQELDEAIDSSVACKLLAFATGDRRLGLLKTKVFRVLYSPTALHITDSELLTRIRQLDDELENWRVNTCPLLRPKLGIARNSSAYGSVQTSLSAVHLQLEYNYLLTMVHSVVRRFGVAHDPDAGLPEDIHRVMHSSIDLALGAARNTIHAISEPVSVLKGKTWCTVFHPLIAAMSLFVNILIHPTSDQAMTDVEWLALASKTIHGLAVTCSAEEVKYLQQAGDFAAELLKLANGAIARRS
ncbi:Transcription factor, fungi [Metarhizium guizhouense ARSEF 977]|uniref:Transcription factor, fungi n=1 Tax=Metarhizium guizhouense (strain ARSEF 977) TaxID=1276136 RepID=A0A0B4GW47_METGA|nr:Transcription factor, fungi [Metarhizium guizhouense ARSEF 977]